MPRKLLLPLVVGLAAIGGLLWFWRRGESPVHYTGVVEGEERVLRSEVMGRVLEVRFHEGDAVPAEAIVAVLDDRDIQARIASKQEELVLLDVELRAQEERIRLVESTWSRDLNARQAELRQAQSAAELGQRTWERERRLLENGVTARQQFDETQARRDQTRSGVDRAQEVLGRTAAEERQIALARAERDALQQRRALTAAQLEELHVAQAKCTLRSPGMVTAVETQFLWPGELAQPGSAVLAVLDPRDKYVQIYVPVSDLPRIRIGQRVALELDSRPGRRIPGEISFVASKANFTPEKIETRSDRMSQVYRAKVRMLQDVEQLQPGTEGNVYLEDKA